MDAEAFVGWVTGIGIILGVIGASWKWIFAEAVRRRTGRTALEGRIIARVVSENTDKAVVQITCSWKNVSLHQIFLDTKKSGIYVYQLENFNDGPLDFGSSHTKYMYFHAPYQHSKDVFYEPGTDSEFTASFKLPAGQSYSARAFLMLDETKMRRKNISWVRDIVFSTRQNKLNAATAGTDQKQSKVPHEPSLHGANLSA